MNKQLVFQIMCYIFFIFSIGEKVEGGVVGCIILVEWKNKSKNKNVIFYHLKNKN